MTGGNQFSLSMDVTAQPASSFVQLPETQRIRDEMQETANLLQRATLQLTDEEEQAHQAMMQRIQEHCGHPPIWCDDIKQHT